MSQVSDLHEIHESKTVVDKVINIVERFYVSEINSLVLNLERLDTVENRIEYIDKWSRVEHERKTISDQVKIKPVEKLYELDENKQRVSDSPEDDYKSLYKHLWEAYHNRKLMGMREYREVSNAIYREIAKSYNIVEIQTDDSKMVCLDDKAEDYIAVKEVKFLTGLLSPRWLAYNIINKSNMRNEQVKEKMLWYVINWKSLDNTEQVGQVIRNIAKRAFSGWYRQVELWETKAKFANPEWLDKTQYFQGTKVYENLSKVIAGISEYAYEPKRKPAQDADLHANHVPFHTVFE